MRNGAVAKRCNISRKSSWGLPATILRHYRREEAIAPGGSGYPLQGQAAGVNRRPSLKAWA
jgi:hypothetical protein